MRVTNFDRGVWFSVEYLVLYHDEPTIADELLKEQSITKEKALALLKETGFQVNKIKNKLAIFKK